MRGIKLEISIFGKEPKRFPTVPKSGQSWVNLSLIGSIQYPKGGQNWVNLTLIGIIHYPKGSQNWMNLTLIGSIQYPKGGASWVNLYFGRFHTVPKRRRKLGEPLCW